MRYTHTNINSPDWRRLSAFYKDVFGCVSVPPERDLGGAFFSRVTGVEGARVTGEHIRLPGWGDDGPTLEIFTYETPHESGPARINSGGFAHIAFEVEDVRATLERLLAAGGSACGDLVTTYYANKNKYLCIVYARDIDGNVVELQKWLDHPGDEEVI